jgi:hypothetical protein
MGKNYFKENRTTMSADILYRWIQFNSVLLCVGLMIGRTIALRSCDPPIIEVCGVLIFRRLQSLRVESLTKSCVFVFFIAEVATLLKSKFL